MRNIVEEYNIKDYSYFSRLLGLKTLIDKTDITYRLESYLPIKKTTNYFIHNVEPSDTLDKLAMKYYGTPLYWWIIADFNDILDFMEPLTYKELKIPELSGVQMR